ncbi:protein CLEC16A homolog [Sitodiplosis mosellana]|uniref:protein CLEC16A homolog n=1 Tax=Sitodiplosis mosellana TaxID=263140 RepID=UPI002444F45F|nr:protein CLEC16A homolog [Sitodiplosis mosellana]
MFRSRSWFGWNKPKNRLSLDHLKYLYAVLERNTTVSEHNRGLLVESLRCIAEILIWGDQNDSSVFDFFLEKNMLSYFLHIMRQKSGGSSFVCVQLLQTLNILFENIRNETSLYYLLSNNHVNSIIVHKFDFSDEDVMGYYILFLKTLSLKLNVHTIHFFYNEHTNDFPLYTEAIKFFNHPESMVRIAVRTISLNVYRVENTNMLQFIRDKTAAPYFSNLVWFIGKHILELDSCVRNDIDHQSQHRLSNLVAEHLDHLHYLNDILCLNIPDLNAVLTEHLLHKLFVPLYIFSLTPAPPPLSMALIAQNLAAVLNKTVDIDIQEMNNPRVSCVVALFLLSLVFLVITHGPLVHALAWVILNADHNVFKEGAGEVLNSYIEKRSAVTLGFAQPVESLEQALDGSLTPSPTDEAFDNGAMSEASTSGAASRQAQKLSVGEEPHSSNRSQSSSIAIESANITDEEKEKLKISYGESSTSTQPEVSNRPFLDTVLSALDCSENDYLALLGLCLIYALANNEGVNSKWLDQVLGTQSNSNGKYKTILIDRLLQIVHISGQLSSRIRLITMELTLKLFGHFVKDENEIYTLSESQHNSIQSARHSSMIVLQNFYKSEDIFLDLFEDEYNEMTKSNLNVEFLCMDSTILLPPTGTPLTGIGFTRRLPCGEVEKARRAIRVYFLLRRLCQEMNYEEETVLPLTNFSACINVDNILDLNNSDLIACTVLLKDGTKYRRFLVIEALQLVLVEPDSKRLGWGIAKLVGFLQDVEVTGDKDDSRCLHITIHRGGATTNRTPILSAKFIFDDHIRCMAAKQRLTKGRTKARQKKMNQIAQLLEISDQQLKSTIAPTSPASVLPSLRPGSASKTTREHRPLFSTANRVPGVAAALRRESIPSGSVSRVQITHNRQIDRERSPNSAAGGAKSRDASRNRVNGNNGKVRSRESSPRTPRPRSEEIPMEDFRQSRNSSPSSRCSSRATSRSHTPSRLGVNENTLSVPPQEHQSLANSPNLLAVASASLAEETETNVNSIETSFIAPKKKGAIETV